MALAPHRLSAQPLCASTPPEALASPITPTASFYIRNHFGIPKVPGPAWRLAVTGGCVRPLALSLAQLQALPRREAVVTLECAGNARTRFSPLPGGIPWDDRAVGTASFAGALLSDVLHQAGIEPGVVEVLFTGADRGTEGGREMPFARSLPVEEALGPGVLLAWEMNGAPLTPEHGAPLRLVVPGWYAVASVKWLQSIDLRTAPYTGWFQHDRYVFRRPGRPDQPVGRMRLKALLVDPPAGAVLPAGREARLGGMAWSGSSAVARVEVSVDGGARWHPADLGVPPSAHAWTPFSFRWSNPPSGAHLLMARAFDEDGAAQPMQAAWNEQGYGFDGVVPVPVTVR